MNFFSPLTIFVFGGIIIALLLVVYYSVTMKKRQQAHTHFLQQNPNHVQVKVLPSIGEASKKMYITKINGVSPVQFACEGGFYLPVGENTLQVQKGTKSGRGIGEEKTYTLSTVENNQYALQMVDGEIIFQQVL